MCGSFFDRVILFLTGDYQRFFKSHFKRKMKRDRQFRRDQLISFFEGNDIIIDEETDYFELGKFADYVTLKMFEKNVPRIQQLNFALNAYNRVEESDVIEATPTEVKNFARICCFLDRKVSENFARKLWKKYFGKLKIKYQVN